MPLLLANVKDPEPRRVFSGDVSRYLKAKLYAWGNNGAGQLGDGTRIHRAIPTRITALPPTTTVTEIAAGNYASLGLTSDGVLYGWGSSQRGRLGLGSSRRRPPCPRSCSPAALRPAR